MSIKIQGLSEAAKIPGGLERSQRELLDGIVERLSDELAKATPGGSGGSVGRSWQGNTISSTRGRVHSGHPGARALARGAFIKGRPVLRFRSGDVRPFARLPRTDYDKRALRRRNRIASEEYEKAFGDVKD